MTTQSIWNSRVFPGAATLMIAASGWCVDAPKTPVHEQWTEETRNSLIESVRKFGERAHWSCEETAVAFVGQYGNRPETVLALVSLLDSSGESGKTKSVAAVLLGQLGGVDARDGLIRFIEQPQSCAMPDDDFGAIEWAIKSLGFVGDEDATQFLVRLASLEYWILRTDRPKAGKFVAKSTADPNLSPEMLTITRLRDCALNGIVNIGTQEALDLLRALQQGKASDMNPAVVQNCVQSVEWKLSGQKPKYEVAP